jgi:hypothetical protein
MRWSNFREAHAASVADAGSMQRVLAPARVKGSQSITVYGSVVGAIIIALSPALFFSFGYHNDFNAWGYDTHACCTSHPETHMLHGIGRYLGAYAENLQFFTIHNLADLWIWRFVGILSVAALAVYYLRIVSLRRPPSWQNALLTIALFTLPTMQFQAVWVSMYMFWAPPILLSLAAGHSLLAASDGYPFSKRDEVKRSANLTVRAFILLFAGLCFYPMSATFLLVPTTHLLLSKNNGRFRLVAVGATVILGSAFVTYFAVHKFIVLPHLGNVPNLGEYGFTFTARLLTEAAWRIAIYFEVAQYFWIGFEMPWFPKIVSLIAVVGIVFCFVRLAVRSISIPELVNLLMACCLFVVAATPLLIVQQFTQTFRVTFTMTGIALLVFYWLLSQPPIRTLPVASLLAVLGVGSAFASVYGTASSANAEYVLDKGAVAGATPDEFHPIVVLRPVRARRAFGLDLRNDFGWLSPIDQIFDLLIAPRYKGRVAFAVDTALERSDASLPVLEKGGTIIDTSRIYGLPNITDFSRFATVSARPRGGPGPMNAVDGDSNTFWEVCNQTFPMVLELDLPAAHTFSGYTLSTSEAPQRMPSAWEIWATSDRTHWRRLQEVTHGAPWKRGESRHFDVEPTSGVTGVKLVITATSDAACMRLYEFRPMY